MVKQRHILVLLISGAALLLLLAVIAATGSPRRYSEGASWQVLGDFPSAMYITMNETDLGIDAIFNSDPQTQHWRETLVSCHGFDLSGSPFPRHYPLLAASVPGSHSFILYAIGWFQAASP